MLNFRDLLKLGQNRKRSNLKSDPSYNALLDSRSNLENIQKRIDLLSSTSNNALKNVLNSIANFVQLMKEFLNEEIENFDPSKIRVKGIYP